MTYGFELAHGDCIEVMRTMPDNSVDAIVTDPPYELGFMGKGWDKSGIANNVEMWREALRVLKPGGHLLAFSGSRTYHRMTCAIEDAGFEVRDQIMWLYGSGFPKSLDVSKAIDKARTEDNEPVRVICRAIRAAMDAKGLKSRHLVEHFDGCHPRLIDHWAARDTDSQPSLPTWDQWQKLRELLGMGDEHDAEVWRLDGRKGQPGDVWQNAEVIGHHEGQTPGFGEHRFSVRDTAIREASDAARRWQGWGTALKPAHEPICVARKPLVGTVAENVLAHGTGALNIDGCRVHADDAQGGSYTVKRLKPGATLERAGGNWRPDGDDAQLYHGEMKPGRWPANIIHDGSDEVLAVFPQAPGQMAKASTSDTLRAGQNTYGVMARGSNGQEPRGDAGSAARFFYCAKASKADRGTENTHPTVKPTDLMRYLCRLVTPPGGVVLDPFMGSGSTGKAAMLEGLRFIGIDMTAEYVAIARGRIGYAAGADLC